MSENAAPQKKSFFKRRKSCPFSGEHAPAIDWKDPRMLGRFISERGKMMPSRITAVSQQQQGTVTSYQTCPLYGFAAICAH